MILETKSQILHDNFAIESLKEQTKQDEQEKKLLLQRFDNIMRKVELLENEMIEKDRK